MKAKRVVVALIFLVVAATAVPAGGKKELPYERQKNLVYHETDGVGLVMDVFVPTGKGRLAAYKPNENGKGLGIIHVASGGYDSDRGIVEAHQLAGMYHIFCSRHYTVFAIRPGSKSKFTGFEMLKHIKIGIRYVKLHADEYGIDPDRLGIMGSSAGGHLSCLTALTAEEGNPSAREPLDRFDTYVKAVGVFFPPTDFLNWRKEGDLAPVKSEGKSRILFRDGMEGHSQEEIIAAAKRFSPIYHIKGVPPPFIFFHGDADPLVPLYQSERMVAALKNAGGSAELVVKKGGKHPWYTIINEIFMMADWFDRNLAGKEPAPDRPADSKKTDAASGAFNQDKLRINQIQVIATHNSYHVRPKNWALKIAVTADQEAKTWSYSHAPLDVQLDRGVRSFELDLHNKKTGFEVFHLPHLDDQTTCRKFTDCLKLIRGWSKRHPRHVPISLLMEIKDETAEYDATIFPIDAEALDRLDAEIRSVLQPGDLITPDDVQGDAPTLAEAIARKGWPTLGESRGKIMFILHEGGRNRSLYTRNDTSLKGRAMFPRSEEGRFDAATFTRDHPDVASVSALVRKGYIIRTRADAGLRQGSTNDTSRMKQAFATGAQIVSTDFPPGEAHPETGYVVTFPGGSTIRVNPVNGPEEARGMVVTE